MHWRDEARDRIIRSHVGDYEKENADLLTKLCIAVWDEAHEAGKKEGYDEAEQEYIDEDGNPRG